MRVESPELAELALSINGAERLELLRLLRQALGSVHIEVHQQAKTCHADLVALATHGRGGLQRLLLGSVADKVLRAAGVPLLVHHPMTEDGPGHGS